MMTYDCRQQPEAASIRFPCAVKILNPADGERIPNVFYASTSPMRIGRFVMDADGDPLASPERKKRWHTKPDGSKRVEYYYDRLEVWEIRPWVAVAIKTGETIAQSEVV